MSKGEAIRRLIAQGMDDASILARVDTTLNSVRWHRSKARAVPAPRTDTVEAALVRFGLLDEAQSRIIGYFGTRGPGLYAAVAGWAFVVNHSVGSRFGQCSYRRKRIEVHGALLDKPRDLRETFFHEIAHALDSLANGRSSGHGAAWQAIMTRCFGLPPSRTAALHSPEALEAVRQIALRKRAARPVRAVWRCCGCGFEWGLRTRKKFPASYYKHRGCGGLFREKLPSEV